MKPLGEREMRMDSEPLATETTARRMYKSSVEQKGSPGRAHPHLKERDAGQRGKRLL